MQQFIVACFPPFVIDRNIAVFQLLIAEPFDFCFQRGLVTAKIFGLLLVMLADFMESDKYPTCAYRGCDGNKCLIGALIPDSLYNETMEAKVIEILVEEYPELDDYFEVKNSKDVSFLSQLQICHDNSCNFNHRFAPDKVPVDVFKRQLMIELQYFAEMHGLNCE